jgi:hypothetical protein
MLNADGGARLIAGKLCPHLLGARKTRHPADAGMPDG